MTYLAKIMYKIPDRIFWIKIDTYREGHMLIEAKTDSEAQEKMRLQKELDSRIQYWQITKSI